MPNIVVFSDGPEGLAQLQDLLNQLEAPEVEPEGYETEELVEDEDLPLIVQIRVDDAITTDSVAYESWADTNIEPEDLERYRDSFPEQEYRLVAVYDEIVTVDYSVDQQEVSADDEIGQLKAEILQLKAIIANYESAQ